MSPKVVAVRIGDETSSLGSAPLDVGVIALIPDGTGYCGRDTATMGNCANATRDLFPGRVDEQARLAEVLSASAKGVLALAQGHCQV